MLPHFADPVDRSEQVRITQNTLAVFIEEATDEAGIRVEEDADHRDDNHCGDEVGHVRDGLHESLDLLGTNLVDQQSKDDRADKAHHQGRKADADGIAHQAHELRRFEELLEVLQANECTASQALAGHELTERKLNAVHRNVGEDEHENHGRQCHEPQLPVTT